MCTATDEGAQRIEPKSARVVNSSAVVECRSIVSSESIGVLKDRCATFEVDDALSYISDLKNVVDQSDVVVASSSNARELGVVLHEVDFVDSKALASSNVRVFNTVASE